MSKYYGHLFGLKMSDFKTIRSIDKLARQGLITSDQIEDLQQVARRYAVAITPAMLELINHPDDPIAQQFVPQIHELLTTPDETSDPIGDHAHSPVKGIVHRYPDRVLLKVTHTCPVYCRFCFRREMVGPEGDGTLTSAELQMALDYIANNPSIWEVILTGGDPLVLSNRRLASIMEGLQNIEHVKVVRFHTRVPVVTPERVTSELVAAVKTGQKAVYVALHANHPQELTKAARLACAKLVDAGIPMISQTVLLKGINDTVDTMEALMRAFIETRIKPYYLHHPDLAPGTSHFRLPLTAGQNLMQDLRGRASGLCQPLYVLDIPEGYGKVPVGLCHVSCDNGTTLVTDHRGYMHIYPDSL